MAEKNEWRPHPRQEFALRRSETEILYGGARGGGKSDCAMVFLTEHVDNPQYRALVLRRNSSDLNDFLDRASFMYSGLKGEVVGNPPEVRFPSGAKFRTGHLKDRSSYEKYLGHEYQRIVVEELTQIPDEKLYVKILGSLRSTLDGVYPQIFCTTNPGGSGHGWVKERFRAGDLEQHMEPFKGEDGRSRIYIPAKIDDNPTLMEKDPQYVDYLEGLKETDPELHEAWRHGNWDVFVGQFFKEFRKRDHVIGRHIPRSDVVKVGGMDWGYSAPFVFLGGAVERVEHDGSYFIRVKVYKEVDGVEEPPERVIDLINRSVDLEEYAWVRCDPAMFHRRQDGSRSIGKLMKEYLREYGQSHKLKRGNNDRIGGWAMVHKWLSEAPDGKPYLLISEDCEDLIETLPSMVHDESKVEDLDTDGRDHWVDALRYMLMHLKWVDGRVGVPKKEVPIPYATTAVMRGEEQEGVDLDLFGKVSGKIKTWKSI